jgi:hypothetical protein
MKEHGLTEDIVAMVNQEILDRFSLCGSIESNTKRLERYQEIGVDMVVYGPPQGATLKGIQRLVEAKNRI